jgi:hypothetical protein
LSRLQETQSESKHLKSFPFSLEMPAFLRSENNPYLKSHMYGMVNEDASAAGDPNAGLNAVRIGVEAQYRAPYHVAKLIEPRIDALRPSQWTQVPASDNLLRELLKMYFLHGYPTFAFFSQRLVLRRRGSWSRELLFIISRQCDPCWSMRTLQ